MRILNGLLLLLALAYVAWGVCWFLGFLITGDPSQ